MVIWHYMFLLCCIVLYCIVCLMYYSDVIMGTMASQITSISIVYSNVSSGADQIKHQSSASLALVRGIHRSPVNSPYKWPVTRKMFPYDDVIMFCLFSLPFVGNGWDWWSHACIKSKPRTGCVDSIGELCYHGLTRYDVYTAVNISNVIETLLFSWLTLDDQQVSCWYNVGQ